jgi:hypothetical protein
VGDPLQGFDGNVYASTHWDPDGPGPEPERLVVGGTFTIAGNASARGVAVWNGAGWSPIGEGIAGEVDALIVWNGSLIASGNFATSNSTTFNHIARWNGSAWLPLAGGVSQGPATVFAGSLAAYQGKLIVGGRFAQAGSVPATNIAAWDGANWSSIGDLINGSDPGSCGALTVFDGKLVAGGRFLSAGGVSANRIAAYDGSAWSAIGGGMDARVTALAVYDNALIAGGEFTSAEGNPAVGIARWSGSAWSGIGSIATDNPSPQTPGVYELAVINSRLYVGGAFQLVADGAVRANHIASWDGAAWSALGSGVSGYVFNTVRMIDQLDPLDQRLCAGGQFLYSGSAFLNGFGIWDGSAWSPATRGNSGAITTSILFNDELVVAGAFQSIGGQTIQNIAAWNGATWRPMVGERYAEAYAFTQWNGQLVAAGAFEDDDGAVQDAVARWDGSEWRILGDPFFRTGSFSSLLAIASFQGELIVGGRFTDVGSVAVNNVARWNGANWQPLASGLTGTVGALAEFGGKLIATGNITGSGATTIRSIAAWNGTAWTELGGGLTRGGGAVVQPWALTAVGNDLYVGGPISAAGGVAAQNIARWDGSLWHALGAGVGTGNFSRTFDIKSDGSHLYAAGSFLNPDGVTFDGVAQWDGSSWSKLGSGLNSSAYSIAILPAGELVACGFFSTADGNISAYFARWTLDGAPWVAIHPQPATRALGETMTLSMKPATGYTGLDYAWLKNGEPLNTSDPRIIIHSTPAITTLTITELNAADTALYAASVHNECGGTTSKPALLRVVSACPADFSGDGFVTFEDFDAYVEAFEAGNPAADFDGDGFLTFEDFDSFVGAFETGC